VNIRNFEFRRGTGLDKRGSWSIGQYIKNTIELYINLDRITVLQDPTNLFRRRLFTLALKGLLEVMHRLTASVKKEDKFKLTSSISAKVEELRRIVSIASA
jgi:hypothetical protein